jgi:hypothetical protein
MQQLGRLGRFISYPLAKFNWIDHFETRSLPLEAAGHTVNKIKRNEYSAYISPCLCTTACREVRGVEYQMDH